MSVRDDLPLLLTRQQLGALVERLGLRADSARSIPAIAAAEVRLSERRPRWRRDVILTALKTLEGAS